jgi:large subunit ribosomal protein L6
MAEPSKKQSRVGKRPLPIPAGVEVTLEDGIVRAKGPKGEHFKTIRPEIEVTREGDHLIVKARPDAGRVANQYQGLTRSLLAGMIEGVHTGFKKSLDFRGVGYRAEVKPGSLKMTVGLSHTVTLAIPDCITAKSETIDQGGTKFPRLHLESYDKQMIGQLAARIRSVRPPEPYKGKGVRYTGEKIREKAGKSGK